MTQFSFVVTDVSEEDDGGSAFLRNVFILQGAVGDVSLCSFVVTDVLEEDDEGSAFLRNVFTL